MYYIAPNRYYLHWTMLRNMIMENYETPEMKDHILVFADYIFRNTKEIRKDIDRPYDKLIIYQLEPLVPNHWWDRDRLINNLKDADEVWDYDLQNIEYLHKKGINAKFKPMRYTNTLKQINNVDNPDIDLLFYGNFTDYRSKYINSFLSGTDPNLFYKMNFVWLQHVLDKQLDEFISRSKIILNLNPYMGETRQQQTRIFYPVINNKCVISQSSEINYFGDSIKEFTDIHSLNSLVWNLLQNESWRNPFMNTNRSFLFDCNKIAIFYHIGNQNQWKENHINLVSQMQHTRWYDETDYIHFGIENKLPLPYFLLKVNRLHDANFKNDTLQQMIKFSKLNPDYTIFYVDNEQIFNIGQEFPLFEIQHEVATNNVFYPNSNLRNFVASASYVANLDYEFLDQPMTQDQFKNWLIKDNT